jgi:hypothetical protein
MQPKQVKKVDGEDYEFYMLDPFKASKLLAKITRSIIQPVGALLTGLKSNGLASLYNADVNFEGALGALAENITEDEFNAILSELLSVVRMGTGMELIIADQFSGRVFHMYKVAYKSFEVNFADFLDTKAGALAFVRQALTQAKPNSTGGAGAPSSPSAQA